MYQLYYIVFLIFLSKFQVVIINYKILGPQYSCRVSLQLHIFTIYRVLTTFSLSSLFWARFMDNLMAVIKSCCTGNDAALWEGFLFLGCSLRRGSQPGGWMGEDCCLLFHQRQMGHDCDCAIIASHGPGCTLYPKNYTYIYWGEMLNGC